MQNINLIKLRKISALVLGSGLILVGCNSNGGGGSNNSGGGGGGGGSSGIQTFIGTNPLTIDSVDVVPVIGDNNTSSVIYVHNNTNATISGITYKSQLNTGDDKFLDENSTSLCATIPAGQSCPLSFTTPALSKTIAQGSALITANYDYANKSYQFNQTLNFARVEDNATKGALFNSGLQLTGAGNPTAYGVVYIYGSGQNKVYAVNSITSNKGGLQIVQGNIAGKQLQSNYVSALEVSAATNLLSSDSKSGVTTKSATKADGGFNATLTLLSTTEGTSYTSTANIGVVPITSGAILTVGTVPIIDSSVTNPTGTLFITNAGNQTATLGTISFPSGVTNTGTGTCGASLAAGAACSIVFTVPKTGNTGPLVVNYTGGSASSVTTTIVWYNSKSDALVQMVANPNPLTFSATIGGTTAVTLTNIGGYDLTGITTSQTTTGGSATATATTPVCVNSVGTATGTNLPVGGSCTYNVTVNDNSTDIGGNINLNLSGAFNGVTYNRLLALGYTSNDYKASLSVSPITMPTITGNNTESATATITVTNNGESSASITNSALSNAPSYLSITNNGCSNGVVTPGSNCQVVVKIGPTTAESQLNGTALYSVTYTGGQKTTATTESANIAYTVQANSQNITIASITTAPNESGTGVSGDPYLIGGTQLSPTLTLTYTNSGTNPIQISGINNTNQPFAWQINTAISTCYNGGSLPSATIAAGASCTIVFNNVLAQYEKAVPSGVGATYTENLILPTLVFKDMVATGTQFQVIPSAPAPISGNTIYVQGNQATLLNNVQVTGSTVTVSQSLANAIGYPSLSVVSQMENYFTGIQTATGCSTSQESGIMTQTCTLNPDSTNGVANASVVYTVNSNYSTATLHVLFNLTTSGVVVSFTPLSMDTTLN